MSMVGLQAFADFDTSTKVYVGSLYYYLSWSNQAQVTSGYNTGYKGNIIIPSTFTYNNKSYSVTSIEYAAFYGCSGLTSITIPNSVTSIGAGAFNGCSRLTSVTIPNSVTSISNNTFMGCSGLTSITIPNSVKSIGAGAFRDCSGLTSVTIPNSVTSIEYNAFHGCSSLTSIVVEADNTKFDSRDNCNAIIETSKNTLITACQNTKIPNSVTSIGKGAFSGYSWLTFINIPNSVTSIESRSFNGLTELKSIVIPASVESIASEAFYECEKLLDVVSLITSPVSIPDKAFTNKTYADGTLYVPKGTKSKYKVRGGWKKFVYMEEGVPAGIGSVAKEGAKGVQEAARYTLDGKRVATPQPGLNIVRMTDGSTRKVVVK